MLVILNDAVIDVVAKLTNWNQLSNYESSIFQLLKVKELTAFDTLIKV